VQFKRVSENLLPPQLTSTIGGTDYYMREIWGIIKTKDDVAKLWPHCNPSPSRFFAWIGAMFGFWPCLDFGQVFIVGASAILPDAASPSGKSTPCVKYELLLLIFG